MYHAIYPTAQNHVAMFGSEIPFLQKSYQIISIFHHWKGVDYSSQYCNANQNDGTCLQESIKHGFESAFEVII